jgi:uroporphyrinogen decarboxylase
MEFGWWGETLQAWLEQGMPAEVNDGEKMEAFFGIPSPRSVPVPAGLFPRFRNYTIEDDDDYIIAQSPDGQITQTFKRGGSMIPHYLKYPLETYADWERIRDERLDPRIDRYPADWDRVKAELNASDLPVVLDLGSLWGWIRDWMGFENACVATAENPQWLGEMMDHLVNLCLHTVERALDEVTIDAGAFWEDMAYNAGPMVSPAFFQEYMTPRYREITDFCKRKGLDVFYVDCDGDANLLIDGWLAGGVQGMFPLERAGHMWPKDLREKYGDSLLLFGGVDKHAMAAGRKAIERELQYLTPVVEQGGFIPFCDHRCPPDVTYANYLYYMKRKCELFGIPKPVDYDALLAQAESRRGGQAPATEHLPEGAR